MLYLMGSHASRQGGRGSGNDASGRVLDQLEFMDFIGRPKRRVIVI